MSPPIHPLASSQGAVFLVNSCQRYFSCGPFTLAGYWASLIPKLRLLFCRVPWGRLTRSPCSTRAEHLCRFAVRLLCNKFREFSWKVALHYFPRRTGTSSLQLESALKPAARIFLGNILKARTSNPIMRNAYLPPSSHHLHSQSGNINPVSIGCGSLHFLRPD